MNFKSFIKEKQDGIVLDIEKETISNSNFRKVIFTTKELQLVLMSLKPNEEIGMEKHDSDQFFRVDKGSGKCIINGKDHEISDGSAFVIPGNIEHNVIAGKDGLKLYTLYSPPMHKDGEIDKTNPEKK